MFEIAGGHCVLDLVVVGYGIVNPVTKATTRERTRITAEGFLGVAGALDRSAVRGSPNYGGGKPARASSRNATTIATGPSSRIRAALE